MNLTLDLPQDIQTQLQEEATKAGVSPTDYAVDLLAKNLPAKKIDVEEQKRLNAPTIALMEEWLKRAEVPATPEEIAESEAELEEFMRNMNAPRKASGERLHYPDVEKDEPKGQSEK